VRSGANQSQRQRRLDVDVEAKSRQGEVLVKAKTTSRPHSNSIPLHLSDTRSYGEVEFLFAGIKILMLVALILFGLVADLGGVNGVYTGGRYWREEPFNDSFESLSPVSLARFLGFWKVLTQAAFAFGGIEGIGVLAGEAFNPRKTMRMAVRTVFYRIGECAPRHLTTPRCHSSRRRRFDGHIGLLCSYVRVPALTPRPVGLYLLAVLMIGLNISQHSPDLLSAVSKGGSTAASSPFVVICQQVGVKVLPSVINAVVSGSASSPRLHRVQRGQRALVQFSTTRTDQVVRPGTDGAHQSQVMTSALSSCNENVYAVSRVLLALARQSE
jgi:amino acid transporter